MSKESKDKNINRSGSSFDEEEQNLKTKKIIKQNESNKKKRKIMKGKKNI